MKNILLSFGLTFLIISTATAQKMQNVQKKETPAKIIKTVPPEPKTPPPVTKEAAPATQFIPVYFLTSARVSIRTGNDNKEFPSQVGVTLMAKSTPSNWRNYIQSSLINEMRIHSDTEFGLDLEGRAPTPLETFQQSGLVLSINYSPNIVFDAWKIESVTLVIEVKDQNGNLHPTLGRKTIVFSNAYGLLNNDYRMIKCITDASFSPLTAVLVKS